MTKKQYKEKRIKELGNKYRKHSTSKRAADICISMECGDFPTFRESTSIELTLRLLLECKYSEAEIIEKLIKKFPNNKNLTRPAKVFYEFTGGKCKNIEEFRKGDLIGLKWDRYKFFSDSGEWDENSIKKVESLITFDEYIKNQEQEYLESKSRSAKERKNRINKANNKPEIMNVLTKVYKRNQDVIVTVLNRANGYCEYCNEPAPFLRALDSTPYLEVHHKIPLSKDGDDTVGNAIALCPNCHREKHYGIS